MATQRAGTLTCECFCALWLPLVVLSSSPWLWVSWWWEQSGESERGCHQVCGHVSLALASVQHPGRPFEDADSKHARILHAHTLRIDKKYRRRTQLVHRKKSQMIAAAWQEVGSNRDAIAHPSYCLASASSRCRPRRRRALVRNVVSISAPASGFSA